MNQAKSEPYMLNIHRISYIDDMKFVLTIIFLFCMLWASAQEYGTVKGKVVDAKDREEVGLAYVYIMNLSDYTIFTTTSDFDGEYSFYTIPFGD